MKIRNKFTMSMLFVGLSWLFGCVHHPQYDTTTPSKPLFGEIGYFDFATTHNINLSVDYGISYPLLFEIYVQDPMVVTEVAEAKHGDVKPVFRAITDQDGKFDGTILLPTHAKQVYIYTNYIGVPRSVKLDVVNNGAILDLTKSLFAATFNSTRNGQVAGNAMILSHWDEFGKPLNLLPRRLLDGELINNIMYSLPESLKGVGSTGDPNNLIQEGNAVGNIKITKNTKINLLFMHEGGTMLNTLAYYCYPTDSPAKSADELQRVIAIPNCSYAYSGGALSSGDCVQLKYWNGTELVEEFPAGTTIGWSLIAYGFKAPTGVVDARSRDNVYYSNPEFNPEATKKQHCVALYDKQKRVVALGFEDQNRDRVSANGIPLCDDDFNDLVFYIETDIEGSVDSDGIPEIIPSPTPAPDPADNFIEYGGTLAYEDLWPSQGDYDMNDVVIDYHSIHYRNANNQIIKIVDKFTPRWSGAFSRNGFGYQLGVSSSAIYSVKVESDFTDRMSFFKTDGKGLEMNQQLATIMLFEDIKILLAQNSTQQNSEKSITVTVEFNLPVSGLNLTLPPYNPFIVCDSGNGRRDVEVHLPNKKPTNLANIDLFGKSSDRSDPKRGVYYISSDNYMFALNLPVSFRLPKEMQRVGQAYGRFESWVLSGGTSDRDWYLDEN